MTDATVLPGDLPVPRDDGAAQGLEGRDLPAVELPSTEGPIDLSQGGTLVLYVYPRTGLPGEPGDPAWDAIPGARGCTPESCAFRDHAAELASSGAQVLGLSSQPLEQQMDFARRHGLPYPLANDSRFVIAGELGLPTFDFRGQRFYKRLTLIVREARIEKVFYPVFPPDRHPADVVAWLSGRADG